MARMVLGPEQLLPCQFPWGGRQRTGEERLVFAILQDAILLIQKPKVCGCAVPTPREDALDWMASDDTDWPFSFVNVCAILDLDPSALRKRVLHWPPDAPHKRVYNAGRPGPQRLARVA